MTGKFTFTFLILVMTLNAVYSDDEDYYGLKDRQISSQLPRKGKGSGGSKPTIVTITVSINLANFRLGC